MCFWDELCYFWCTNVIIRRYALISKSFFNANMCFAIQCTCCALITLLVTGHQHSVTHCDRVNSNTNLQLHIDVISLWTGQLFRGGLDDKFHIEEILKPSVHEKTFIQDFLVILNHSIKNYWKILKKCCIGITFIVVCLICLTLLTHPSLLPVAKGLIASIAFHISFVLREHVKLFTNWLYSSCNWHVRNRSIRNQYKQYSIGYLFFNFIDDINLSRNILVNN